MWITFAEVVDHGADKISTAVQLSSRRRSDLAAALGVI